MCCCKVNSGSVRAKGPPNLCVERRTQTFCKSVNRSLGTKSIIHLPHTCNATQWAIKLLNSQLGFFFVLQHHHHHSFIHSGHQNSLHQPAALLCELACAPGGLGARHPSPPLHGGRDGRQQVLLGETQQVTVNGHVAKGDAQQAAGPTRGLPSHRFRLALEWDASAARYVGKGCYVNVRVFFLCFPCSGDRWERVVLG